MSKNFFQKLDKNVMLMGIAVVGIIIVGAVIYFNENSGSGFSFANLGFGQSNEAIAQKAVDYINNNPGLATSTASLGAVSEASGLVKFKIKIGENEFDSYATKDGKLLFASAFELDKKTGDTANEPTAEEAKQSCDSLTKTDAPELDAFVVSRCPFGLQMQRMMAEAIKDAPALAQYLIPRYMGTISGNTITAMHGEAEATENFRQICIREEQPAKYWNYVSCQMKAAGTETVCEKSTGVDSAKLTSCMQDAKRGLAYAKVDFDLTAQYGVTGSPTLMLGSEKVSEFGFGGRTAEALKQIICCGSKTQPAFCLTELNKTDAATSFSAAYAGAASSGNSGANGANCAPAQ